MRRTRLDVVLLRVLAATFLPTMDVTHRTPPAMFTAMYLFCAVCGLPASSSAQAEAGVSGAKGDEMRRVKMETGRGSRDGCEHLGFDEAMARAVRLVRAQKHAAALPCLEAAHSMRADNSMAALYLAEALLRTHSLQRAAATLQGVLQLDPQSVMARLLLASIRQHQGLWKDAAAEYARVLSVEPSNVAALVNR